MYRFHNILPIAPYNVVMTQNSQFKLIALSDVHGSILAHSYHDNLEKAYGLSRFSTYLSSLDEEILIVDNGDSLQGSPLLSYDHLQKNRPVIMATALNALKVSYYNLGNHDFNYGQERLLHFIEDMDAKLLTTNVLYHNLPLGRSRIHTTTSGLRLGLIGVCTDYIPHWERPENIKDFTFLDPIETVLKEMDALKNQVDQIIVLYHGGLEKDPQTGLDTERQTKENVGYALSLIEGIDVLITGHQHRSLVETIGTCLVTQTTLNAQECVCITLNPKHAERIDLSKFDVDRQFEAHFSSIEKKTQTWLDQTIGFLPYDLRILDPFKARLHKHALVSFINQVQKDISGAQLSATALFNEPIGFKSLVSMRDLVSTYIYPNTLVVKKIDGKSLRSYLEKNAEYFSVEDDQIIVNPSYAYPKAQHFNYDMIDGISYTLKISNPIGSRCIECLYEGKDVQDDDHFSLVINNYRAAGGGDFTMISSLETLHEIQIDMVDILAQYFMDHPKVELKHMQNIKVIL